MSRFRNTNVYKLTWNIFIDLFRETTDINTDAEAYEIIRIINKENREILLRRFDTAEGVIFSYIGDQFDLLAINPLNVLFDIDKLSFTRALEDFKKSEALSKYIQNINKLSSEIDINPDELASYLDDQPGEARNILLKSYDLLDIQSLYNKDVPILPDIKGQSEQFINNYIEQYKKGNKPFIPILTELPPEAPQAPQEEGPDDPNIIYVVPGDTREPVRKTQRDLLAPNLTMDPQQLYNDLKNKIINKNPFDAKHIDVPYLTTVDNINRLHENNKLQSELNNGSSIYRERIKQWHITKDDNKYDKYGLYKPPAQIPNPFN